jgi:hypothetical protein
LSTNQAQLKARATSVRTKRELTTYQFAKNIVQRCHSTTKRSGGTPITRINELSNGEFVVSVLAPEFVVLYIQ